MDVRQLRSFIAIANAGSFSRAAQDLHIAQPALSRQISQLEEELGIELLTRHGRGVALTASGVRLLERAEMIAHYMAETPHLIRDESTQERGHIAVGLTPAIGQVIGPSFVESFHAAWPMANLHAREGLSTSLQNWLLEGSVHLAIVYNQPTLDAFDLVPLFVEPMVLVAPPNETARSFRLVDIAQKPLILPALPHSNRRLIEQAAKGFGLAADTLDRFDSMCLKTKTQPLAHRTENGSKVVHARIALFGQHAMEALARMFGLGR